MGENAKRLFFVYNPHSGRGNIRSKLFDIVQVFSEAGYEITIYPTREAKDATRQIEHLSDQYDLVVCSGGDEDSAGYGESRPSGSVRKRFPE